MTTKYQDYLAGQVLSEGQIVNYRNVSRALKVHVNVAKQMLFEFHRIQNRKKPGSIHATYLVCGVKKAPELKTNGVHAAENGDMEMSDSLPPSSMPGPSSSLPDQDSDQSGDDIPIISITLARVEELDAVKHQHSRIDAIHVYSLEPGPVEHVQLLSDCTRRVVEAQAKEDPLETWKQYGTIHNPRAKRRTGVRPPQPAPAPAVPMTAGMRAAAKPATAAPVATKKDESSRPSSSGKESGKEDKSSKPASLRRESSSLFKSFAKTKAPKKQEERSKAEDEEMADPSEDEESELHALPEASKEAKEKAEADRKFKADREATLKKMMEDDDEEATKPSEEEDAEMQDPAMAEEQDAPQEAEPQAAACETKEVSTSGGRRRGRRRIMKKKHFKDAEGYMVTKEEPAWESFSEDEAPPPAKKAAMSTSSVKSTKDDKKKKAGKAGQGNLMSFFGKK